MLIGQTQVADTQPVRATEHLQQLVMPTANRLLEYFGGRDQLVLFESGGLVVRLDVQLAVGGQAHQARSHGLASPPCAHVALHVDGLGEVPGHRGLLQFSLSEFLHHVGQHGVPGERGPRGEGLSALRADEHPQIVILVPVILDTVRAVAVSARNGDRVSEDVQTYRAIKVILVQDHPGLSHQSRGKWAKTRESIPSFPFTFATAGKTGTSDKQLICLQEARGRG